MSPIPKPFHFPQQNGAFNFHAESPKREISSLLRQLKKKKKRKKSVHIFPPTANVLLCIKFKFESLSRWSLKLLFSLWI